MTPSNTTLPSGRQPVLSVGDLTRSIKRLLETGIGRVQVEGEIANWTVSSRGHAYFVLKDDRATLSCVLFQGARAQLPFTPKDGVSAVATGVVSVYEARGQYQLIVSAMQQSGLGDLYRRFLELKERLEKEGLFAPERKRPLPRMPERIGVVTSPTGAAFRDILNIIGRRAPCVEIVLAPTLVQGRDAADNIARAIRQLGALGMGDSGEKPIDVMIVGRGGGSIEDLWAFNEEVVARAIYDARVPVISAVGHETDFTIADFVADLRAPTPSAAAEIVAEEIDTLIANLGNLRRRMIQSLGHLAERRHARLDLLLRSWGMRQPLDLIRQTEQRLDDLISRATTLLQRRLDRERHRFETASVRLLALNPTAVLERGYSIVQRAKDGRVVTRSRQVRPGDHLRIRLSEGDIRAAVMPQGDDFLEGIEPS
jgi:exodeoxyribonuclease VII large subunit